MIDRAGFERELKRDGYDEMLVREWEPNRDVPEHTHPFDARALVLEGEFTLNCQGSSRVLRPGDVFAVAAGTPHTESYGPQGARFLVGRRQPAKT